MSLAVIHQLTCQGRLVFACSATVPRQAEHRHDVQNVKDDAVIPSDFRADLSVFYGHFCVALYFNKSQGVQTFHLRPSDNKRLKIAY